MSSEWEYAANGSAATKEVKHDTFEELVGNPAIEKALTDLGYDDPTPVQRACIGPMATGSGVVTGPDRTGKRSALCIAALSAVNQEVEACQAVVLAPSVDACNEIVDLLACMTEYTDVTVADALSYPSHPFHVLVGTPGRVLDAVARGAVAFASLAFLGVYGGADMAAKGCVDAVITLVTHRVPSTARVVVTTRDPVPELSRLVSQHPSWTVSWAGDPLAPPPTPKMYTLRITDTEADGKLAALVAGFSTLTIQQAVLFCNSRRAAEGLILKLQAADVTAACVHGGLPPHEREYVLRQFRRGDARVLATCDSGAVGVDAVLGPRVPFVIHYDLPGTYKAWEGRVWRFGADHITRGVVAFVGSDEEEARLAGFLTCAGVSSTPLDMYEWWEHL